jgi:hypothetical protein
VSLDDRDASKSGHADFNPWWREMRKRVNSREGGISESLE